MEYVKDPNLNRCVLILFIIWVLNVIDCPFSVHVGTCAIVSQVEADLLEVDTVLSLKVFHYLQLLLKQPIL